MDLSIIIVSYNVKFYLAQCLDSVKRALEGLDAEVIVVDNHSHDGTSEEIHKFYPWVKFVGLSHNLGFSKANNIAIRECKGRYVLLLNPDTIVGEHVLKDALTFMDGHPQAGGVGVRMLKIDGSDALESRRGIPTPMTAFWKMSGLCRRFPTSHRFARYYMGWLSWDQPSQIQIMSGAFCLMRHKMLDEVGLLDEDFFMYGEDIDLSYRILKDGWQNWYLPLRILHYKGESTQKSSFRYVHVFYEAMLIFFRKHSKHYSRIIVLPVQLAIYLKAAFTMIGLHWRKACQSMGFVQGTISEEPLYIFHVTSEHEQACRNLAYARGLRATFERSAKEVTHEVPADAPEKVYHVYDTSVYHYEDLLKAFSLSPRSGCMIATWNPHTERLITDGNVFIK